MYESTFIQPKQFIFIKELESGRTGGTKLFKDETVKIEFAIKKYSPYGINNDFKLNLYHRFVDEIKILFQLTYKNKVLKNLINRLEEIPIVDSLPFDFDGLPF